MLELQCLLPDVPSDLAVVLPDGFTTEVCSDAVRWWRDAAARLECGRLLTLDYGLDAEEFLAPNRSSGTLRGYRRHRIVEDVLADPGDQDLTAHVNFTAIGRAGESVGLRTVRSCSQAEFLTDVARVAWDPGSGFGDWTSAYVRQFQTLTHPEHLGRAFRLLLQSR